MSVFHPERPTTILHVDQYFRKAFNEGSRAKFGILLLARTEEEAVRLSLRVGAGEIKPMRHEYWVKNLIGKKQKHEIYYGILAPAKE
jgi:hypothetical protein